MRGRGPSAATTGGHPGGRYYATRVRQLAHLDLDEPDAQRLWRSMARHRRELARRLGRDVGQRVALLDFIVNVRPHVVEPRLLVRAALNVIDQRTVADAVTGLYSRHYFDVALRRETERCRRHGGALSLVLLDLDRFNETAEAHGRRAGTQIVEAVGILILRHVRAADVPCRRDGGGAFAIILPDTPGAEAHMVAERIRGDIAGSFEEHLAEVTASGGISTFGEGAATADELFRLADRRLDQARAAGGNRIVASGEGA